MKNMTERLTECLFKTKAIRICPANEPFWYTSGKIGPYYINTHFLYGSEEKAAELLKIIDNVKEKKEQCTEVVFGHVLKNYMEDSLYKTTIDALVDKIREMVPIGDYQYVSGGERRDWFFSLIIAHLVDKPHITIFKDLDFVIWHKGKTSRQNSLDGAKILHVADLITSASSYERAWIPAIRDAAGKMGHSFVIIDRMQGGSELLKRFGVDSHSLVKIDEGIFREAYEKNYINAEQYDMVIRYIEDPDAFMERFFNEHPDFIEKALRGDEKTAERAKLCIKSGFYPKM